MCPLRYVVLIVSAFLALLLMLTNSNPSTSHKHRWYDYLTGRYIIDVWVARTLRR